MQHPGLLLAQQSDSGGLGSLCLLVFELGIIVAALAGFWKVFVKAGKPGWAALIPIYNAIVLMDIVGRPIWWVALLIIPFVNFVVAIIVALDVANRFSKGTGFGIGLAFLPFIFYPILGFGDAQYRGK